MHAQAKQLLNNIDHRGHRRIGLRRERGDLFIVQRNRTSVMEILDENGKGHKCRENCGAARMLHRGIRRSSVGTGLRQVV